MSGNIFFTWVIVFFTALAPSHLLSKNSDSIRQKAMELFHQTHDQVKEIYLEDELNYSSSNWSSSTKSFYQEIRHFRKNFRKCLYLFGRIPQKDIIPNDAYYIFRLYDVLNEKIPEKKLTDLVNLIETISLVEKKIICYKILGDQAINFDQDVILAIHYYEKALFAETESGLTDSDLNIHYQLFKLYSHVGKEEKSYKHLESIVNHPSSFNVPEITFRAGYYLANFYYNKNIEKSIEIYNRLYPLRYIAKKEERKLILHRLIEFAVNKLEYQDIYSYYVELSEIDDGFEYQDFFFIFGFLYDLDKWRESSLLNEFRFSFDKNSNLPRKKFIQAIYHYYENNKARSIGILQEFLNDKNWKVHALSAICQILKGRENYHEKVYFEKIFFNILFKNKLYDKINENFISSSKFIETYPEYNYYLGYIAKESYKTNKAKQYFLKYLHYSSPHEVMLLSIAPYFESLGDYSNASLSVDKLLQIYPQNIEYLLYSAYISRKRGDDQWANQILEKVLIIDPTHREALYSLGVSYYDLGDFEKTKETFERLIQTYPQTADYYNFLGYTLAEKNMDLLKAKSLIEKALNFDPDNEAYLDSLAWVFYQLKNYSKAQEYIDQAIVWMEKKKQNDPIIYEHAGDIYRELGRIDSAIEYWQKCLALNYEHSDFVREKMKKLAQKLNQTY